MERPSAIFFDDPHLGEKPPLCRVDDYRDTEARKLEWVADLWDRSGNPPLIIAGDIFDKPRPPLEAISLAAEILPHAYVVAGQHDLPGHSILNIKQSGLGVLIAADRMTLLGPGSVVETKELTLCGASWGEPLPKDPGGSGRKICVLHRFTFMGREPWPGCPKEAAAPNLMKELPWADCIVTGDNHKSFVYAKGDALLVNAGSMMRRRADQEKHKPRVFLYFAKDNSVKPVFFPIDTTAVSREHIEQKTQLDERVQAFIAQLGGDYEVGLSFEKNVRAALQAGDVDPDVEKIVLQALESSNAV